jgi:peptidoglycan/LPS O-acetylase OafA/YrhL
MPKNLKPLTALRFFAAMWVVAYQFWPTLGLDRPLLLASLSSAGSSLVSGAVWVYLGELSFALYMISVPWGVRLIRASTGCFIYRARPWRHCSGGFSIWASCRRLSCCISWSSAPRETPCADMGRRFAAHTLR